MADDILKDCKKLFIQEIVNPGLYWMTEYESSKYYNKEVKQFESLLEKSVQKLKIKQNITIGNIVAVKDKTGFHRGLVTDIFNRDSKIIYWLSLIDQGRRTIETSANSLYDIKHKELKVPKPKMYEVSVKGIQPASVVIESNKCSFGHIFQKRKCAKWSSASFNFVIKLFQKNPQVFVKGFKSNERKISGGIYLMEASNGMPISLSQKLCDEGFAINIDDMAKFNGEGGSEDDMVDIAIEEKIPRRAYLKDIEDFEKIEPGQKNKLN